jgi:hypothetical protein
LSFERLTWNPPRGKASCLQRWTLAILALAGTGAVSQTLAGHGRLGEYGDVSMVWQGPRLAVWAFEKRKIVTGEVK